MKRIEETESLCPVCEKKLPATVFERDKKVWIKKKCPVHGITEELYWGDAGMYKKAMKFAYDGRGIKNPAITKENPDCPFDCGLCKYHLTHTALANIVLTNRCDLSCWYCFFYAKKGDRIYEPTLKQLKQMFKSLRKERPVPCNAIQFTGGEPTLRKDLIKIVKSAKEAGFDHLQFNTNGINFALDPSLPKKLREAGVNTVYMSFDGVTSQTNPKNHWEAPKAIENCRKVGMGIVLVPTVIGGFNDHELGDIIRFAAQNSDVIKAVNFQPVSLVGMMPQKERKKRRITIPDACRKIQQQTGGQIKMNDFYAVPCVGAFSDLAEMLSGREHYSLSVHPACGTGTYVFLDKDKIIPITNFVDIDGLFAYMKKASEELKQGKSKTLSKIKILYNLRKFIDLRKKPKGLKLAEMLYSIILRKDYKALAEFHYKTLFVGMMHFQDLYNYDVQRVRRCAIHYAVPGGKIIPFCAFNVLPSRYRDKIQEKHSISPKAWEKKNKQELKKDKYYRDKVFKEQMEKDYPFMAKPGR